MHQFRNLESKSLFGFVYTFVLVPAKLRNFVQFHKRKQFHALFHFSVLDVAEILIKIINRAFVFVQPQCAFLGFSHLFSVGSEQQRAGHTECVLLFFAAYKIDAGKHIRPLIVSSQFQLTVIQIAEL